MLKIWQAKVRQKKLEQTYYNESHKLNTYVVHYWRRMLCRGPDPETLGKGFAEGCPRQRPLGEFLDGEGVFAEGPLSGTWQRKEAVRRRRRWRFLCRGPTLGKEVVFF